MDLREIQPETLEVSDMNERDKPPKTSTLVESIKRQGVIQPPIVRENGGVLEVVAGQRRAVGAERAGLGTIPVVVMDWGDAEALEASITENIDAFREDVSTGDRTAAIQQLMELTGDTQPEVAERLGVPEPTVRRWMEPMREEWEGTRYEPEHKKKKRQESNRHDDGKDSDVLVTATEDADEAAANLSASAMANMRRAADRTDDPGETLSDMTNRAERGELNATDADEIAQAIDHGEDYDEAADRVADSKDTTDGPAIGVQLTLPGSTGSKLESRAEADGVSKEEIVRRAVRQYLDEDN